MSSVLSASKQAQYLDRQITWCLDKALKNIEKFSVAERLCNSNAMQPSTCKDRAHLNKRNGVKHGSNMEGTEALCITDISLNHRKGWRRKEWRVITKRSKNTRLWEYVRLKEDEKAVCFTTLAPAISSISAPSVFPVSTAMWSWREWVK